MTQLEAFSLDDLPAPMTEAVRATMAAAAEAGRLTPVDAAMVALALKVAAAIDRADARADSRGVVAAARQLESLLTQLGLGAPKAPRGRPPGGSGGADLAELLAGLAEPTLGDPAHA